MRARLIATFALLIAVSTFSSPAARAGIEKFIDDKTILAGEADLTRLDADAVSKWASETFKTAHLLGPEGPGPTEAELTTAMAEFKRWLADAKAQGASVVYLIAADDAGPGKPFVTIVPCEDAAKAKAIASLMYSGTTTGPSSPPAPPAGQAGEPYVRFSERAEVVAGVGVMRGTANRIAAARAVVPKPRPDLDAALKAAGKAPVKLAVAPTPKLVATLRGAPMPIQTALKNTKWLLAAAADVPPTPAAKITIQATDAEAAKQLQQMLVMYIAMGPLSRSGLTPEFTKLLAPTIQGDQVLISLDEKQLVALAGEMKGPLALSKEQALRVRAMSNMRQILMACIMYNNDNKKWPEDLKSLEKYLPRMAAGGGGKNPLLTDPRHPDADPAFIYCKPAEPILQPAEAVVLYESHNDFTGGVNVGFADGHVELVNQKERLDELLAKTEVGAPPQ
jgi:prepilin-type processing-associated H-X9-DG protein